MNFSADEDGFLPAGVLRLLIVIHLILPVAPLTCGRHFYEARVFRTEDAQPSVAPRFGGAVIVGPLGRHVSGVPRGSGYRAYSGGETGGSAG